MSISHLLSDFSSLQSGTNLAKPDALETLRLDAFEQGYRAGWDDAGAAYKDSTTNLSQEFLTSLCDLSLTHQEAYKALQQDLIAIVEKIGKSLIPEIVGQSFVPTLVKFITDDMRKLGLASLTISVHPENEAALRSLLDEGTHQHVTIETSPTLRKDQAILGTPQREMEFTFTETIDQIRDDLAIFLYSHPKGTKS
ncbi:hypothetical protein N9A67_03415 [Rhodobacteraceae bacterium]|nr:hypothetical protein [Paracoccaceae bacterium]